MLSDLMQDIRFALRGLRRSPGFTATVILTLGLGIGANAAMFGVIDRMMFRPYNYLRDPDMVHRVYIQDVDRERTNTNSFFEYTRYLDLKKWSSSFSQFAGMSHGTMAIGEGEASRERRVARVNATYFDFFDVRPALGRFFTASEDTTPRGADVAVLGYDFWKAEFGQRNVIGERLQVGNLAMTIVGVAPRGFTGISDEAPAVYMPITTYAASTGFSQRDPHNYYTRYNWGWMSVMMRRKDGVSREAASTDLSQAYVRSWNAEREFSPQMAPVDVAKPRAIAGPLKTAAGPDMSLESKTLLWVSGVAAIVLLIACANVTNLMFARVLRRRREYAVRLALGVSRGRLLAQSMTESMVLSLLGCTAGVAIAQWGGLALRKLFVQGSPGGVFTDGRTLLVAGFAALVAGLLTGLAPALLAAREDVLGNLKAGVREGTQQKSRTRSALLVFQAALSVILLVGAGLFVRSLSNVKHMRIGFEAGQVLMATANMRGMRIGDSAEVQLGRRLLETGIALPGVEHASWVSSVPFWSTSSTNLYVTGIDSVRRLGRFTYQTATTDYFAAMGTRIIRGRGFTSEDRGNSPRIAVVSDAMARVLWPGQDAIGQCMRVSNDTMPCTTVVGIAEDAVQNSLMLDEDTRFRYYLPIEQHDPTGGFVLLLRMRGNPETDVERVRGALQPVMPGQSYITVRPMQELIEGQQRSWRVGATMFVAFGVLALVVAAVGLYGVIAYSVAQRMHELGVRIALGAQARDIVRLVVGQGVRVAVAGVVIGLGVALWVAKWIQPLLFEQKAKDPVTFSSVAVVLIGVALLASAVPAVRATRADPNAALRSD